MGKCQNSILMTLFKQHGSSKKDHLLMKITTKTPKEINKVNLQNESLELTHYLSGWFSNSQ